jgi:hypothetical protein
MKFKALRKKAEPQEFVEIHFHRSDVDPNEGVWVVYTSELPNPQPENVTMELMKGYYAQQSVPLPEEINLDNYELVQFEFFEINTVGADIRNKLSPPLNLISLLRIYFKEESPDRKAKLKTFVEKEMENAEKSIKYIANLL